MTPAGAVVEVRGERWLVAHAEPFEGCTVLTLHGQGRDNLGATWRAIEPFDRPVVARRARLRVRRRDDVLRVALAAAAQERPASGLWAAADASFALVPYQLEPALAVLDGATRLLLADAVGLGKTVQAGLILAELQMRGLVGRALILTPAGLRGAWATELRVRFGIRPTVLDLAAVESSIPSLPVGTNPWSACSIVVASIDLVKRLEVLAAVEAAPFDLLIVDEAHHLTPGSDRGAAVQRLATRIPWLVLVSATPHSGDDLAFAYLTRLGALGEPLRIFRRSRADVGRAQDRRERLLAVRPTLEEAAMHAATEAYARAIWRARGADDGAVRLVATTLARRSASSAAALERTLVRRLALLSGRADPQPTQPSLPWEDTDEADGDADAATLGRQGLEEANVERRQLEHLVALAQRAGCSSKVGRILRVLNRVREPVVIFTEYRDTLESLARRCAPRHRIATIHGGVPLALRQAAVHALNEGDVDVLIATDTAGEGLNLQHRCRLVFNMELPWNPFRLEQRVGRVDRIGQTRRVHAVHLYHRGTIEDTVLARLERRRQRAGAGIDEAGSGWAREDEIAAAALGDAPLATRREPAMATAVVSRAAVEAARLEHQRACSARRPHSPPDGPVWARPRRRAASSRRVVLLYDIRHVDALGRLVARHEAPIRVELRAAPRNRREWRRLMARLRDDPAIQVAVEHAAQLGGCEIGATLPSSRSAIVRRLDAVSVAIGHEPAPLQAALFDRRADREAEARREVVDRLMARFHRRADGLRACGSTVAGRRIELIAAWPSWDRL